MKFFEERNHVNWKSSPVVPVMEKTGGKMPGDGFLSNDSYDINIKMPTGKIISLKVKASDTIGSVKLQIEVKEHIPFEQQEVFFKEKVLENINTLGILHINKDSTLKVMEKTMQLIEVFVKPFTGNMIALSVKPMETIANVKSMIESKINVPCEEQALVFNNMVLTDDGTLFDFHINTKSTLTLMRKLRGSMAFMNIFIKTFSGKTITLQVKPIDTIESIKAKIQDMEGIACNEQELIFNKMVLQNEGTLVEFHINKESTLTLMRVSSGFKSIFIEILKTTHTVKFYVKPSDTIYRLKVKIYNEVGIHPCVQILISNGRRLEDKATLADYQIPNESTIKLSSMVTLTERQIPNVPAIKPPTMAPLADRHFPNESAIRHSTIMNNQFLPFNSNSGPFNSNSSHFKPNFRGSNRYC